MHLIVVGLIAVYRFSEQVYSNMDVDYFYAVHVYWFEGGGGDSSQWGGGGRRESGGGGNDSPSWPNVKNILKSFSVSNIRYCVTLLFGVFFVNRYIEWL